MMKEKEKEEEDTIKCPNTTITTETKRGRK